MKFENTSSGSQSSSNSDSQSSSSISSAINAFEKKHFSYYIGTDAYYRDIVLRHEMGDALYDHDLAEKMMLVDILKELPVGAGVLMVKDLQELISQFGETEVRNYLGLMSYASRLMVIQFIEELNVNPMVHMMTDLQDLLKQLSSLLDGDMSVISKFDPSEAIKAALPCVNALGVFEKRFFSTWVTSNGFFENMLKEMKEAGIPEKAGEALIKSKVMEDVPVENRDDLMNELGFLTDVYGVDEIRKNLGCISYASGLIVKAYLELYSKVKNSPQ